MLKTFGGFSRNLNDVPVQRPPSRPPLKSSVQSEADIYDRWSQKLEGWIPDSVHPLFFFFP